MLEDPTIKSIRAPIGALLLIVILQVSPLAQQNAAQTASHSTQTSNGKNTPPPTPIAPSVAEHRECKELTKESQLPPNNDQAWIGRWSLYVNGALALATFVLAIFAVKQANAAKANADAALLSAQAVINSDRPWVIIFATHQGGTFSFRAGNLGKTPAEIISFAAEFRAVGDIKELPPEPEYGIEHVPIIKLLVPGENLGDAETELLSRQRFTDLIYGVPPKLAIFYFRVLYKNPISRLRPDIPNHETRMCFRYSQLGGDLLEVCGNDNYNQHT